MLKTGEMFNMFNPEGKHRKGIEHGTFPLRIEHIEHIEHFPCFKHIFGTCPNKDEHIEHFPCFSRCFGFLVGKCSATRYSVAAPPPGARYGLGGPMHPRHPLRWQRERCDRGLWEGCSCDTPATHSELRNEPRQGCSYTVERDRGGL